MKTRWSESLERSVPLPQYPRPQMRRDSYLCLNGLWQYAITDGDAMPSEPDGDILVPFSPEAELSGVMRALKSEETLWYTRELTLPEGFLAGGRLLLHFGAVDQVATVFVNGRKAGSHTGGYTPFCFDITDLLDAKNILTVKVRDYSDTSFHSRGKQKTARGGIWYTPQSGIWQTVWCERVPRDYISRLIITPLFDESAVEVTAVPSSDIKADCTVRVGDVVAHGALGQSIRVSMRGFAPWSPESPYLYTMEVRAGEDTVRSYFAMRKFSVEADADGIKRLFLNNAPYFHNGVLDQGYWPDGLYTAPSDEAMVYDIETMKAMGFNTLRKHIKIEPARWYYHCDVLGMLVWQDMPSGGEKYRPLTVSLPLITKRSISDGEKNYARFGRASAEGRVEYYAELEEMVRALYNSPCIAMWVPFNEGWGQFDAAKALEYILSLDTTRTVDHASGWHDQKVGDFKSLHVYFRPYAFEKDDLGRSVILTEFGGYNLFVNGHTFGKKDRGYKRLSGGAELLSALRALYESEIIPAKKSGLAAAIYTQLSDVEDELNGLVTYDREVEKLPRDEVASIMAKLASHN